MNKDDQKSESSVFRNRHRSRELALQTLYACEVGTTQEWKCMLDRVADTGSLPEDVKKYARELVQEVLQSMEQIDETIRERAANWELRRMAAIDRNILRIAVAELRFFHHVPAKVVIDEAVELAKTFGAEDSGKFVNGIIDSIHKKMKGHSGMSGKDGSQHGTNPRSI